MAAGYTTSSARGGLFTQTGGQAALSDVGFMQDAYTAAAALTEEATAVAVQTAAHLAQTDLDATATAADRVQTGLDATATAADRVALAADLFQTNLDTIATAADRAAVAADLVQTDLDTIATAADRVQTGLDAASTASDLVQTNIDQLAVAAALVETNQDTIDTAADVIAADASAVAAALSETNAGVSETNASVSAGESAVSAADSANSAAAAAAALDTFDDRYLGSMTVEPTVDNDGDALVAGALYFNSTANEMRVYDGASWIAATSAGSASLILYEYTATSGQTTFSGTDDNTAALSYTVGNIQVVMNGVILDPSEFTATSGTSIVLAAGAATSDILNVYAFKSFTVADTVSASAGGTFAGSVTFAGGATGITGLTPSIDDNAVATAVTIDSSGNVGIGAATPATALDVTGTITATSFTGDGSNITNVGGGFYKGENGEIGNPTTGAGDIFRVNDKELNTNVTIDADENASAAGPLAIATGVTLTVTTGGNLSIV